MLGLVLKKTYDQLKKELNKWIYTASKFEHERDVYRNIVETWVKTGREELSKLRDELKKRLDKQD